MEMQTQERVKCPDCGMPTIENRKGLKWPLQYEEMLCNRCYEQYEERMKTAVES